MGAVAVVIVIVIAGGVWHDRRLHGSCSADVFWRWSAMEEKRRRKGNGFSIINRFVTFYPFCVSCRVGRGRYK